MRGISLLIYALFEILVTIWDSGVVHNYRTCNTILIKQLAMMCRNHRLWVIVDRYSAIFIDSSIRCHISRLIILLLAVWHVLEHLLGFNDRTAVFIVHPSLKTAGNGWKGVLIRVTAF